VRAGLISTLLLCSSLCGACPARQEGASGRIGATQSGGGFSLAIPGELLSAAESAIEADRDLRRVYCDPGGTRVLATLRGKSDTALWTDLATQPAPVKALFPGSLLAADCARSQVFCLNADGGRIMRVNLADPAIPPVALPELEGGASLRISAADVHPASGLLFVLAIEMSKQAPPAADTGDPASATGADASAPPDHASEPPGDGMDPRRETVHSASPPALGGDTARIYRLDEGGAFTEVLKTAVGAFEPSRPPRIAALADGSVSLYVPAGQLLWMVGPSPDGGTSLTQIQELGDSILSADAQKPVAWLYAKPVDAAEGSGREQRAAHAGELVALELGGKQLCRLQTGDVPFNQIIGDITNMRCLLALSSAGVALASADTSRAIKAAQPGAPDAQMQWLLRHGGGAPLFLADGQVWAGLSAGLYRVSADELVEMSPQFSASQTMPRGQVKAARNASEALGWDWKQVQLSPLAGFESRLVLFDSAGRDASTAEMQWDARSMKATHVLLTRAPGEADLALLKAAPGEVESVCGAMLAALGWPGAQLTPEGVVSDEFSVSASYQLGSADQPGGNFSLWITDSVALVTLDAPRASTDL
jgi:hypothetical protein